MSEIILIIDFMNYVHRCRTGFLKGDYALIFNFFRNFRATVEQFEPSKIFFALEGHPKHRYDLYPEYKANRRKIVKTAEEAQKKEDIDLVLVAANEIKKLLASFPVSLISSSDFEADDIINSLCYDLRDENVVVVSSDTDFIQILQIPLLKNIKLYNAIKKEFIIPPEYPYLAWKCIVGDKSDNIPGIKGDKTAIKIISDPEKFTAFMKLEEHRANFNINKCLIEFQTVPVEKLIIDEGVADWNYVKSEFDRMEFASITNDKSWTKYVKTFNCIKY